MIERTLVQFAETIDNSVWLAPFVALIAGLLTSFTPCSLSTVPLIIGYVGGVGERDPRKAFAYSVVFSLGSAVTFVALGVLAVSAGRLMGTTSSVWLGFLGALTVLMAMQTWEIFNFIPSTNLVSKNTRRGYIGAFLAGVLGGIFSSPCSTPILIALLAMIAGKGAFYWGVLLMFLYALGHSALAIVAGTSLGFTQKIVDDGKCRIAANVTKFVMGALILFVGYYMFYLAF